MAYQPSSTAGRPGKFILEPDASVAALRHEMQHFRDDLAGGFPGLGSYLSYESFWGMEYRAYMTEIRFARSHREFGLARRILALAREAREDIFSRYGN
jgi:hypothetical protein